MYGSFTIPPQEGNAAKFGDPVLNIDTEQGKTWNSMGLPNIGIEEAMRISSELEVKSHANGKLIAYSGSPTNAPEHGTSVEQATRLAYEFLDTDIDLIEINVSCPNVVTEAGGRKPIMGYDLETMTELVNEMAIMVGKGQRLGVKLPPYLSDEDVAIVPELAKLFRTSRVFRFLATSNTVPNQIPTNSGGQELPLSVPGGAGGMSGSYTALVGREQLDLWYDQTRGEIDIISSEGLDSGWELAERMRRGAKAGAGVTFLWRSANWKDAVDDVLTDFADQVDLSGE